MEVGQDIVICLSAPEGLNEDLNLAPSTIKSESMKKIWHLLEDEDEAMGKNISSYLLPVLGEEVIQNENGNCMVR